MLLKMEALNSLMEDLMENEITVEQLQELTGFDDLSEAHRLTLSNIVTKNTPIHVVGDFLPNVSATVVQPT